MTDVDADRPPGPDAAPGSADRPSQVRRGVRRTGIAAGIALALGAALLVSKIGQSNDEPEDSAAASADGPTGQPVSFERPVVSAAELEAVNGVRIESVSLTGAGGLIDLRFLVVEPNKAAALHEPATPPVIVDEATGLVVSELLMGHSHTGPYRAGGKYYLIFVNPGNLIRQGTEVAVLLGNTQLEHVVVE